MKWLPTVIAVATAISLALSATVQGVWAAHPAAAGIVTSVFAIVTHLLPSPASVTK